MKKIFMLMILVCILSSLTKAQNTFPQKGKVGIFTTTPNPSAALDIDTTGLGLLIPRMTKNQRDGIKSPATALLIYQTNSTPGFYYYDGSKWVAVSPKGVSKSLNNLDSTAINQSLFPDTTATFDLGSSTNSWKHGYFSDDLSVNGLTIGRGPGGDVSNTALGYYSLLSNTSGAANTAVGSYALSDNTTGIGNTAVGESSLTFNINGYYNVATGGNTLHSNISGNNNTAFGFGGLNQNSTGSDNIAIGTDPLFSNNGDGNIGIGTVALQYNTSGSYNVGVGYHALDLNGTGTQNTAVGSDAMLYNSTGIDNTAFGDASLYYNTTGSNNSCFGFYSQVSDGMNNATAIGNSAFATASNQVRIGNSTVTSIGGQVSWSTISDARVKKNIKQNVPGLAFINKLNPVTYNLDMNAIDKIIRKPLLRDAHGNVIKTLQDETDARKQKEQVVYTGLLAQDVEKAAKETGYDFSGVDAAKNDKDLYGLRYSDFVMPLIKAVQELSKQNEDQQKEINELKAIITGNTNQTSAKSNQQKISLGQQAKLEQNQPNPTTQSTTIKYFIPEQTLNAFIKVTNVNGQEVKSINLTAKGNGQISIQTNTFVAGNYFYSLIVDGKTVDTKSMVIAH